MISEIYDKKQRFPKKEYTGYRVHKSSTFALEII